MTEQLYTLQQMARFGLGTLTEQERASFEVTMSRLLKTPVEEWSSAGVRKVVGDETFYVVPLDESLRALVRPTPEGLLEVLDFVRRETLELFRSFKPSAGKAS